MEQALQVAESGHGLAIGRRPMVDDRLARGTLVAPFGAGDPTGAAYYLCRPSDAAADRRGAAPGALVARAGRRDLNDRSSRPEPNSLAPPGSPHLPRLAMEAVAAAGHANRGGKPLTQAVLATAAHRRPPGVGRRQRAADLHHARRTRSPCSTAPPTPAARRGCSSTPSATPCTIRDLRPLAGALSLDHEGFELRRHETAVARPVRRRCGRERLLPGDRGAAARA